MAFCRRKRPFELRVYTRVARIGNLDTYVICAYLVWASLFVDYQLYQVLPERGISLV